MTATAETTSRPPSVLVPAFERYQARTAAVKAAGVLPAAAAGAPAMPVAFVPAPVMPPPPAPAVAAVDPAAALASAWEVFGSDGLTASGRYDLALEISALVAGAPVPATISTAAGRAARVAAIRAELDGTTDPRVKGKLALQHSALVRGETPRPESGLSAAAVEARNADLIEQMKTADPRRKYALAKAMLER